jgi:choline kinase
MQAVILAAGLGNRLGDLTSGRPKALVPVAGRELILRTLDFVDHPAITERLVVTGYEGERLRDFLADHCPAALTVHNPHYRDGSIRTIETALDHISGDFLLMNVDHIYPRRMLDRILEKASGIAAICDFDRELVADDMKVKLTAEGKLWRIRKTLTDYDGGYIGMTSCAGDCLEHYKDNVLAARKAEGDAAAVEMALATLADCNKTINICDVSGMGWLEVDTQDDLLHAEQTLRDNPHFLL